MIDQRENGDYIHENEMIPGVTVIQQQQQQQQQQISFLFFFCVRFENSKDPKMAKFFQTFRANKLSRRAQFGGCEGKFKKL